jgi:hypothetical protein
MSGLALAPGHRFSVTHLSQQPQPAVAASSQQRQSAAAASSARAPHCPLRLHPDLKYPMATPEPVTHGSRLGLGKAEVCVAVSLSPLGVAAPVTVSFTKSRAPS